MSKNKTDEIYSIKEENRFAEYHSFPDEQYLKPKEEKQDIKEEYSVEEVSLSNGPEKQRKKGSYEKIKQLTEKINLRPASAVTASAVVIVSASAIGIIPVLGNQESNFGEIIPNSLVIQDSVSSLSVSGKAKSIDNSLLYKAELIQYKDKRARGEPLSCDLSFDDSLSLFSVTCPLSYGLDSYSFSIVCYDGEEKKELYKESRTYSLSQDYQAEYTKLSPVQSRIEFFPDGRLSYEVDTGFTTSYPDTFSYRIDAIGQDGKVCGSYSGNDSVAVFESEPSEEIYFRYAEIGTFYDGEKEYSKELLSDFSHASLPMVLFDDSYEFLGDYFALSYQTMTVYESDNVSLELTRRNKEKSVTKTLPFNNEKGFVVLDDFEGEIGTLELSGYILLEDSSFDAYSHKIPIEEKTYERNYAFQIESVYADISSPGEDFINTTFDFSYQLPYDYKIQIKDEAGLIDETIERTDTYTITNLPSGDGGTLSVTILDQNGNSFIQSDPISILPSSEIDSLYQPPDNFSQVNPGNSLVTYNEDGSINLYRDRLFSSSDRNVYYDTFLFTGENRDDTTGKVTYIGDIHNRSRERISAREKLPRRDYIFKYYLLYQKDGIYYRMDQGQPSGSLNLSSGGNYLAQAEYNPDNNKTLITITNNSADYFENRCTIEGKDYSYDDFPSERSSSYSLTLDGDRTGKTIEIYANPYLDSLDTIQSRIALKGEKYDAFLLNL